MPAFSRQEKEEDNEEWLARAIYIALTAPEYVSVMRGTNHSFLSTFIIEVARNLHTKNYLDWLFLITWKTQYPHTPKSLFRPSKFSIYMLLNLCFSILSHHYNFLFFSDFNLYSPESPFYPFILPLLSIRSFYLSFLSVHPDSLSGSLTS